MYDDMNTLLERVCFTLTSNPDIRFLALLGSRSAPGHTLTPVLVETEDLLHLLSGDFNRHLHDWQRCKERKKNRKNKQKQNIIIVSERTFNPHQLVWR